MPTETTATATSENLFGLHEIETDQIVDKTLLFEAITTELEEYLLRESDDTDSTGVVFEVLSSISEQVQEEFNELLGEDTCKKRFLESLSKIFTLLLNTKVTTPKKIKKIIKITLKKTRQAMVRTKLTDRRLHEKNT